MKRSSPYTGGGPTKRSRIDINPDSGVVRLRGLPYSAGEQEIRDFFKPLDLEPTHVRFILNAWGKDSGSAFVVFPRAEDIETAMKKDKQEIGTRYIEIFRAGVEDVNNFPTRSTSGDDETDSQGGSLAQLTLRLRGLPFSVSEDEILGFFDGFFFFLFSFFLLFYFCFCFCFCFFFFLFSFFLFFFFLFCHEPLITAL